MGDIGYRRKGESTPLYNPERDFAYTTPTLMRVAIESLDAIEPPEKVNWRADRAISQAEVAKIAEALALAQSDFVNAADPVSSFEVALERHGFFNFNYETRQFLFAAIGEIFCAAWFLAVREVSTVGEESPAAIDMSRFTAAVRAFAANADLPSLDQGYVAEYRKMQNDILRAQVTNITDAYKKQREDYYRILAELNTIKKERKTHSPVTFWGWVRSWRRKNNA